MSDHVWTARPIEEAPKDKPILAYDPDYPWDDGFCICGWMWARNRPIEEGTGWAAINQQTGESLPVEPIAWWELPGKPA